MSKLSLRGTLGCKRAAADGLMLAVASPLEQRDNPPRVAWIVCVVRDQGVQNSISPALQVGDRLCVEGFIEPQRRRMGELAFHSVAFVVKSIERLPPK